MDLVSSWKRAFAPYLVNFLLLFLAEAPVPVPDVYDALVRSRLPLRKTFDAPATMEFIDDEKTDERFRINSGQVSSSAI